MRHHAIKIPPQHASWNDQLALWLEVDRTELFESAWTWDHFYPLRPPFDGSNLDGWTTLAAVAQATSRIRLGAMVNGMHHRHPAVTANMAATLDVISGGRFVLGLGAGWNEMESGAYGIELGSLTTRLDRFDEGVTVIRSLLDQRETTFVGDHYRLTGAWCEPKPVQAKLPIVIGGKGRKRTLRTVATWADQWDMAFPASPEEWQRLDEVLREHCLQVGRDQSEITRSIHIGDVESMDPTQFADRASGFFDAGVDLIVWSVRGDARPGQIDALAAHLS